MGLGYPPLKDKATQMGIEHITVALNKPTDRGYIVFAQVHKVARKYQHSPKEAHEANQAKLPTIRILSHIQNIPGAELESMPKIQAANHIATNL
jgi:hypothetical protein